MDKRIASNLVLGAFTLIGLTAFVFLLFSMGGGQGFLTRQYSLFARFSHVKGLHKGSEVSLSGLRIGIVRAINVSSDGNRELIAELAISRKYKDQIRRDSVARVLTQGILGDKYIEITIGTPSAPPLEENSEITTVEIPDVFSKGGNLIEGISKHFGKDGDIEPLLKNLNKMSENLAVITATLRKDVTQGKGMLYEVTQGKSGEHWKGSMAHLESILRKVDSGEGTLGALVNDPSIYEDLKSVLGGAKRSSILKYFLNQFKEEGKASPKK